MTGDTGASERLAFLIGRIAMRDRAAFKELYDLTNRFLFSLSLRQVGRQDRAEDVLQESFMEVWQKAETYSAARGTAMTWLITIVRRRSIDEYRRLERTNRIIEPADIDPEASGPDEAVIFSDSVRSLFGADVMGRLEGCFAQLSADQRRAITDIRVRGMTYEEAAQFYKVPRQTVAARVRRGIESLTECMRS